MRVALLLLCTACTPRVEVETWAPLDVEGLQADLAQPTATVDDVRDLVEELAWRVAFGRVHGDALSDAQQILAGAEAAPDRPGDGPVQGTTVYARIACPGPRRHSPDPDFRWGWMTVESPLLTLEDIQSLAVPGDLLLQWSDCQAGDFIATGTLPTWHDTEARRLALGGEVFLEQVGGAGQVLRLRAIVGARWRFAWHLDPETWGVLDLDPEGDFRILLADAEVACTETEDGPSCEWPSP